MKKIIFLIMVSFLFFSCAKSILTIEKKENIFIFELEVPDLNLADIDSAQLIIELDQFKSQIDFENKKIITEIPAENLFSENQTENLFRLEFELFMKNGNINGYNKKVLIYKKGKIIFIKGD